MKYVKVNKQKKKNVIILMFYLFGNLLIKYNNFNGISID